MRVAWLRCPAAALPDHDDWLCPPEREKLAALRLPRRRADFRLGRFAAKRAVARWLGEPEAPERTAILAAQDGAPEVFRDGARMPCAISLSHREGWALCALSGDRVPLGCDLERIEARAPAFAGEWLCEAEQRLLGDARAGDRELLLTLLWSAKESALKALRTGLRRDPRDVCVMPEGLPAGRGSLAVVCAPDPAAGFPAPWAQTGHWERFGALLGTVVAEGLAEAPQTLGEDAAARPQSAAAHSSDTSALLARRHGFLLTPRFSSSSQ